MRRRAERNVILGKEGEKNRGVTRRKMDKSVEVVVVWEGGGVTRGRKTSFLGKTGVTGMAPKTGEDESGAKDKDCSRNLTVEH